MRIVWATDARQKQLLAEWVSKIIWPRGNNGVGNCQAMAIIDGDDLIAGVLFHNWDPEAGIIELTSASIDKRWITRPVLKAMFEYPFIECKCQVVVLRVSDDNQPMHRIAKAYGFEHYIIPRLRGRESNENVFVLTDDAWKTNRFNRKTEVH
jgi:RimJ/RimL family protein N-acetyltransferase